MVMSCPECPQTTLELESFFTAISDPRYDLSPDDYRRVFEEEKKRMQERGLFDRDSRLLLMGTELDIFPDEFESDYKLMRTWGETREKAARHYSIHLIDGQCENCVQLYTQLRRQYVSELAEDRGIDTKDKDKLDMLILEADLELFGFPVLIPY